jgi:hypothetical protein
MSRICRLCFAKDIMVVKGMDGSARAGGKMQIDRVEDIHRVKRYDSYVRRYGVDIGRKHHGGVNSVARPVRTLHAITNVLRGHDNYRKK